MNKNNSNTEYTLGLDLGIASVGWCVLGKNRIIDLGVRCFEKAEVPKTGESLNLKRRESRLSRNRLSHRRLRLNKVAKVLCKFQLIDTPKFFANYREIKGKKFISIWQLRVMALEQKLEPQEWARVIYHICKHRGFYWVSKAEEKTAEDDKKETGKVKQALNSSKKEMAEYQTLAQMILAKFPEAQRNKADDYSKSLPRILLAEELSTLFEKQRELGNKLANIELQKEILGSGDRKSGLFWQQKPPISGEALLKMLGKCRFEKNEFRAPKHSYIAERHVWLTRLNNLRINTDGTRRSLNAEEREALIDLPYSYANGTVNYEQVAKKLIKCGFIKKDQYSFIGLNHSDPNKNPEKEKLVEMKGWSKISKAYKELGLIQNLTDLISVGFNGDYQKLDQVAHALTVYKIDEEKESALKSLGFSNQKLIDRLLEISLSDFSNLSLKVLYKIVPEMEKGLRYDQACQAAGYHHSEIKINIDEKLKYLPPIYQNRKSNGEMIFNQELDQQFYIPRNPVVIRAINQAKKVINEIVRKYGSPINVHIELARELSKSPKERREIENEQKKYQDRKETDKKAFIEEYSREPQGSELLKFQLYRQQDGKCAYSLTGLDLNTIFENGEIDHILPFSRSYDDSLNNKVLVKTSENRNKANQTPYEYLDGENNSERWQKFKAFCESNSYFRQTKKNKLLCKELSDDDSKNFLERNLNDTRYICRFMKNYIENYLKLSEQSSAKRVVVVAGQMTSLLRLRWGLIKVREENDRHHALDAAVVAACSRSMVMKMAEYSKSKELDNVRSNYIDPETGEIINKQLFDRLEKEFPKPWRYFREELVIRLFNDNKTDIKEQLLKFASYQDTDIQTIKPLFVSHAPQRRVDGAVHLETIYGLHSKVGENEVAQRLSIEKLNINNLTHLIGYDDPRNQGLIRSLTQWINKGKDKNNLPRKPLKSDPQQGPYSGPIIRNVKINIGKTTGIPIRGGLAANATMVRIDLFKKDKKYYIVPVYLKDKNKPLPNRAIVAGKDENDWQVIDESFNFCMSLYPNDLIKLEFKNKVEFGYYRSCQRGTGNINICVHDRNQNIGKDGIKRSIGIKTALGITKYHVDVLGNIFPVVGDETRKPI